MMKPNFKEEFNSNSFTGWRDKNKLWEGGGRHGQTDRQTKVKYNLSARK
jgi:hypothetical protein